MSVIPDTRLLLQDGAFAGWTVVVTDDPEFTVYSTGSPYHGIHFLNAEVDKLWMEVGAIETYGSDGKAIPGCWRQSVFNDSVPDCKTSWLNLAKVRREQPEHVGGRVPMPDPYANANKPTRVRSGEVNSDDSLVAFLYVLMRDHLTPGVVEEIILNHVVGPLGPGERQFTNGWLASYAKDVAERLRTAPEPMGESPKRRCSVHGVTFMGADEICHWGTGGYGTCPRPLESV